MEIQEIKHQLSLSQVLEHYGLKPDKNLRLPCPFHEDKTPSMQVYYKTQSCYCFSSNCRTHGKSLDVIDFIMYKERCSKHEALKKCVELIGGVELKMGNAEYRMQKVEKMPEDEDKNRIIFLEKMFSSFRMALFHSNPAKEYLLRRNLDYKQLASLGLNVGYNGGQFHHGERKDESLINQCLKYGLLLDKNLLSNTGEKAYSVFAKSCIVFPLKNKNHEVASLYFRGITDNKESRHYYLKNRQGLYPSYPDIKTKTLILTESIIDAATLLMEKGQLRVEDETPSILSLYGTNGMSEEHLQAIKSLKELREIVFFFDGDEAGRKSTSKYGQLFKESYPGLEVSCVNIPENEDVNSLLQGHDASILSHLMGERKAVNFSFSAENKSIEEEKVTIPHKQISESPPVLDTSNPYNLKFPVEGVLYQVKGFRSEQFDSLKITLQISKL